MRYHLSFHKALFRVLLCLVCFSFSSLALLRFDFIDDIGEIGHFVLDETAQPESASGAMTFYDDSVIREITYRTADDYSAFHTSVSRQNSLWGISLAGVLPASDFNLLFEGTGAADALPSDPGEYRFISGSHYSDRWGYRTIAAVIVTRLGVCGEGTEPHILTHPQDVSTSEGQRASFWVDAAGSDLDFQWKKNGENIPGAQNSWLIAPAVRQAYNGDRYSVVVSNAYGQVASEEAVLTVEEFSGIAIPHAADIVTPNGEEKEIDWANISPATLDAAANGAPSSEHDLSASTKFLADDNSLYALVNVTDDQIDVTGGAPEERDGVTLVFHDAAMENKLALTFPVQAAAAKKAVMIGASAAVKRTTGGYVMEISIPRAEIPAQQTTYLYANVLVYDSDNQPTVTVAGLPSSRYAGVSSTLFKMRENAVAARPRRPHSHRLQIETEYAACLSMRLGRAIPGVAIMQVNGRALSAAQAPGVLLVDIIR